MREIRLFSWNVNGLRACTRKGFASWLRDTRPDVLALQEVRATPEQLEEEARSPAGYQVHFHPAARSGYSGVALYSAIDPNQVVLGGLDEPRFDTEGRLVSEIRNCTDVGTTPPTDPAACTGAARELLRRSLARFRRIEIHAPFRPSLETATLDQFPAALLPALGGGAIFGLADLVFDRQTTGKGVFLPAA